MINRRAASKSRRGIAKTPRDPSLIDASAYPNTVMHAARESLEEKLNAVVSFLPPAANQADETTEHVHRLRVSTRRALAALTVYHDCIPRSTRRWMRAKMKEIRTIAGAARDLDVMMLRCDGNEFHRRRKLLCALKKRRRKTQKAICNIYRQLVLSGQLPDRIDKMLRQVSGRSVKASLEDFGKAQLSQQLRRFFAKMPEDTGDIHQIHRFRIQAKSLRYTMELLGELLPAEAQAPVYSHVCKLQSQLGELNDLAVAHCRLRRMSQKASSRTAKRRWRKLAKKERRRMEMAIDSFQDSWSGGLGDELRQAAKRTADDAGGIS